MVGKVEKIKDKVYDEILETEMALTRLEIEPLESIIPEDIKIKSNKALLYKMNTLKQRTMSKRSLSKRSLGRNKSKKQMFASNDE